MGNGFSYTGALFAAVLALGLSTGAASADKGPKKPVRIPGELIVKFKQAPGEQLMSTVTSQLNKLGQGAVLRTRSLSTDARISVIKLKSDSLVSQAIKLLKAEPSVRIAEPNYKVHLLQSPNDVDFAKLWGMRNTGQMSIPDDSVPPRFPAQTGIVGADINVFPVWNRGITGSKNIVVAIIDTGISWTHPDLVDNLYTNPKEIPGNGIDDDGNGFIDDVHGWNFNAKTANSADDHDHGTHCAGTIGGKGNNGIGVAGVNWNVSLLPVKFLSAEGSGSLADAVDAINYATMMNVNVMSNSWGGGGFSQVMLESIQAAKAKGILFIAAAGNDGGNNDTTPSYPASYDVDNVISVAATDNHDSLAWFSNYGMTKVHVAAPGVQVYSSVKDGTYKAFSGTSMATPHVAGAAALLLSANPNWDYRMVKQRLIETSTPIRGLKRKVAARGRINVDNAMTGFIPPNPEPPESAWLDGAFRAESEHPYKDNVNQTFTATSAGAKFIRLHFSSIDTEANYDKITIKGPTGEVVDTLSGSYPNGYTTEYVAGGQITIEWTTDGSVQKQGWVIDKLQYINEVPANMRGHVRH